MKTFKFKDGSTGISIDRDELPDSVKGALAKCDATYKANQEARKALATEYAKVAALPAGQAFEVTFNYGKVNLKVVKAETAKAETKVTLADWLKAQTA